MVFGFVSLRTLGIGLITVTDSCNIWKISLFTWNSIFRISWHFKIICWKYHDNIGIKMGKGCRMYFNSIFMFILYFLLFISTFSWCIPSKPQNSVFKKKTSKFWRHSDNFPSNGTWPSKICRCCGLLIFVISC